MARRKYGTRKRVDELSTPQLLELMLGPRSSKGLEHFRDDGHAEDVYRSHREQIFTKLGAEAALKSWAYRRYELHEHPEPIDYGPELREHERQWAERDRLSALEDGDQGGERPEVEVLDYRDVGRLRGVKVG